MKVQGAFMRGSARTYRRLLRLYPASFVTRFGDELGDTFESSLHDRVRSDGWAGLLAAWSTVGRELPRTLACENIAALAEAWRRESIQPRLRASAAAVLPAGAFLALIRFSPRMEETVLISLWLLGATLGVAMARGRGRECLVAGTLGGAAGALASIVLSFLHSMPIDPPPAAAASLVVGVAVTLALTMALFMRLIIEGVSLGRSAVAGG